MKFKVLKQEYLEVDIHQNDIIDATVALLTKKLKEQNRKLNNYFCFFLKNDRFWGIEEIVTSHRSDEERDITDILTDDQKEMMKVILYLQKPFA